MTANTITAGNVGDADAVDALLDGEDDPVEVLGDTAYAGGKTRANLADRGHAAVIKPPPLRPAVPGGFDRDDFDVDHDNKTVTCPNGETVPISAKGNATFAVTAVLSANVAPPARPVEAFTSAPTTVTSSLPAPKPKRTGSLRPTRDDLWLSSRSHPSVRIAAPSRTSTGRQDWQRQETRTSSGSWWTRSRWWAFKLSPVTIRPLTTKLPQMT